MFSNFKSIDLSDNYSVIQPPAGLITAINKRLKLYEDGSLTYNEWAAIFVLACLHLNGEPVIGKQAHDTIGNYESCPNDFSIRFMYCDATDVEFEKVVEEFLFNVSRDALEEWFNVVDSNCFVTKKAVEAEKND